jgi:hypothetical protein
MMTSEAGRNLDMLMPAARLFEIVHKHEHKCLAFQIRNQFGVGKLSCPSRYVLTTTGETQ